MTVVLAVRPPPPILEVVWDLERALWDRLFAGERPPRRTDYCAVVSEAEEEDPVWLDEGVRCYGVGEKDEVLAEGEEVHMDAEDADAESGTENQPTARSAYAPTLSRSRSRMVEFSARQQASAERFFERFRKSRAPPGAKQTGPLPSATLPEEKVKQLQYLQKDSASKHLQRMALAKRIQQNASGELPRRARTPRISSATHNSHESSDSSPTTSPSRRQRERVRPDSSPTTSPSRRQRERVRPVSDDDSDASNTSCSSTSSSCTNSSCLEREQRALEDQLDIMEAHMQHSAAEDQSMEDVQEARRKLRQRLAQLRQRVVAPQEEEAEEEEAEDTPIPRRNRRRRRRSQSRRSQSRRSRGRRWVAAAAAARRRRAKERENLMRELFRGARTGDATKVLDSVRQLRQKGYEWTPAEARHKFGSEQCALHVVARKATLLGGTKEELEALCELVDLESVSARRRGGNTPLHDAVSCGNLDACATILVLAEMRGRMPSPDLLYTPSLNSQLRQTASETVIGARTTRFSSTGLRIFLLLQARMKNRYYCAEDMLNWALPADLAVEVMLYARPVSPSEEEVRSQAESLMVRRRFFDFVSCLATDPSEEPRNLMDGVLRAGKNLFMSKGGAARTWLMTQDSTGRTPLHVAAASPWFEDQERMFVHCPHCHGRETVEEKGLQSEWQCPHCPCRTESSPVQYQCSSCLKSFCRDCLPVHVHSTPVLHMLGAKGRPAWRMIRNVRPKLGHMPEPQMTFGRPRAKDLREQCLATNSGAVGIYRLGGNMFGVTFCRSRPQRCMERFVPDDACTMHVPGVPYLLKDMFGSSPLHVAALAGNAVAAQEMMAMGCSGKQMNKRHMTPLHMCIQSAPGSEQMARVLHQCMDTTDGKGRTPLHLAAAKGSSAWVDALLKTGSDPAALDSSGKTAYELAMRTSQKDVIELLRPATSSAAAVGAGRNAASRRDSLRATPPIKPLVSGRRHSAPNPLAMTAPPGTLQNIL